MVSAHALGGGQFAVSGCGREERLDCRVSPCAVMTPPPPPPATLPAELQALPSDELHEVLLRAQKNEIRPCYERAWATNPTLRGRLYVHFTIATDGSVRDATVTRSTLGDQTLERCVQKQVERLVFARRQTAVNVSYPLDVIP